MTQLSLKPTHAAVKNYYAALTQFGQLHFDNEAQVIDAFAKLLTYCGKKLHLTFIPQFTIERAKNRVIDSAPAMATPPSPSGTSSTTSTPSCTTPSTASATPPTSAANCRAFRSPLQRPFPIVIPNRLQPVRNPYLNKTVGSG